jgi:NarL family two-component system response regulator LiaR
MSNSKPIRILLADDHAVVRSGLSTFFLVYDDLELVGEATNGKEAVQLCKELQPDVVLMDLVMPVMDGAAATKLIREQFPTVQVVALTSFPEEELVQGALKAGAISYLLKNVSADELAQAIRAAHIGRGMLAPEAAQVLIHAATHPHPLGYDLTPREKDTLGWMVEGLNNPQIAEKMVVTRSTVKFHVSNVLSKLAASNRTEAVRLAIEHKILVL